MIIKLFILLILLPSYVVRCLLWLTRLQQKEYRWDRFWHFITQGQSKQDLFKLIPNKKNFTRTGLTRPKLTPRLIVVTLILQLLVLFILVSSWPFNWWLWLIVGSLVITLLPLLILIASLPTGLVFEWQVRQYVSKAKQKINQEQPQVIGITGSYGKTSTKILLQHILQAKFSVFATQKSFNTRYSLARDIALNYHGQKIALIEYAAYKPGEISWLAKKIKPHWALITGLAPQHLAIFGSLENIIKAKAELIQALPKKGLVFLNTEDKGTLKILKKANNNKQLTSQQIIYYSGKNSKVKLSDPTLDKLGRLNFIYKNQRVHTQLIGYRSLSIVKAGIAVAQQLLISEKEIIKQLESFSPPSYFLNFQQTQQGFWILDDGRTTNPVAFADAIKLTKEIASLKQINHCYLITSGIIDLGKESEQIHQELAKNAKQVFEKVIYTGLPGKKQFSIIFKDDLIEQDIKIKQVLNDLSKNDLLVIEGWIPLWLKNYLFSQSI